MSGGDEPREMIRRGALGSPNPFPELSMPKGPFHREIQHDRQRHRPTAFPHQFPVLLGQMPGLGRQDEISREVASVVTIRDRDDCALSLEDLKMMGGAAQRDAKDPRKLAQMDSGRVRDRLQSTLSSVRLRTGGPVSASGSLRHK